MSLRLFIPAIQGKYHRQISLRSKVSVVKIPHSTIFLCTKYSEIIACIINVWGLSSLYCLYEEAS